MRLWPTCQESTGSCLQVCRDEPVPAACRSPTDAMSQLCPGHFLLLHLNCNRRSLALIYRYGVSFTCH